MSLIAGTSFLRGNTNSLLGSSDAVFPSNADVMHTGITTNSDGHLAFDSTFILEGYTGNTPAAKGHFILDAFNQDLDTALGCAGTGSRVYTNRPAAVAFHQGRVFYAAPVVQNRIGGILYSQQLTQEGNEGKCYQEADPTAADINDLVDTDGGFLPMPSTGEIYAMKELSSGIVIFASNGVWYLTGAEQGSGISATNIKLDHISTSGALSASSIVAAEGSLFYFSIDGIVQITHDGLEGIKTTNITQTTIQEFYINISAKARELASAVYIPEQRKIFWAYKDTQADDSLTSRSYDKYLILDFEIQGFYKYSIPTEAGQNWPEIVGLSLVKPLTQGTTNTPVLELDGSIVTELDGTTPVTENSITNTGQVTQLKSACMVYSTADDGYKVSFATFHSRSFTDWRDVDNVGEGVPMDSYVEFAEFNMEAVHTRGKPTYVHSFYERTSKNLEPGGYYELPPLYYVSTGLRVSQSVIEVLNRPSSNLRMGQSVVEVLMTAPSDFRVSQSVIEVIHA